MKEELRRRGYPVAVLNIGENRKQRSHEYVDVQSALDFLRKVFKFAFRSYRFHIHLNALSKKGFVLSYVSAAVGAVLGLRPVITFHGGLPQDFFPVSRPWWLRFLFRSLFRLSGYVTCDAEEIRDEIIKYGIPGCRVKAVPCISSELFEWTPVKLRERVEAFIVQHKAVFFSYVRLRPEYGFEVLLEAMQRCVEMCPQVGFIWMGPSARELPVIESLIRASGLSFANVMLLQNADHDEFLTTMSRCVATIRAHGCDGVSASVLESLSLGIPVIACEDGRRPLGVITYDPASATDLLEKIDRVLGDNAQIHVPITTPRIENNTDRMIELLLDSRSSRALPVTETLKGQVVTLERLSGGERPQT